MGKSNKVSETFYRMAQYWGFFDTTNVANVTINQILISGAVAWTGEMDSSGGVQTVSVDNEYLFGYQGQGIVGDITFCSGLNNQTIPNAMATMMGYASSLVAPAFRNVCSLMFSANSFTQGFSWGTSYQMRNLIAQFTVLPNCPGLNTALQYIDYSDAFTKVGDVIYWQGQTFNLTEGQQMQIGDSNMCTIATVTTTWNGTAITIDQANDNFTIGSVTIDTNSNTAFWYNLRQLNNSGNTKTFTGGDWSVEVFGYHTISTTDGGLTDVFDYNVRLNDSGCVNPVWIIYDTLYYHYLSHDCENAPTDPSTIFNIDNFNTVAQTLFDEGIGMSIIRNQQQSDSDFLQTIKSTINCALYTDNDTGLWNITLVRDDYTVSDLTNINESQIISLTHTRKSIASLATTLNVQYTNPQNMQLDTVTVMNNALNLRRNYAISTTSNYPGITDGPTALKLAKRDLQSNSYPFAGIQMEVQSSAFGGYIYPGDVFTLSYNVPGFSVDNVVFRVLSVDYGSFDSGTWKITASEDIFTLPTPSYSIAQAVAPTTTINGPADPAIVRICTTPYYFVTENGIDTSQAESGDALGMVLATPPNADCFKFDCYTNTVDQTGNYSYDYDATLYFTGHGSLSSDLPASTTSTEITLANLTGTLAPAQNYFLIIDNADDEESFQEIALITAINTDGSMNLARGVLDTIPRAYPAGTSVWVYACDSVCIDPTQRAGGETVEYALVVSSRNGQAQSLAQAETVSQTLTDRYFMPVCPKNVTCNGTQVIGTTSIDCSGSASASIEFCRRNRLTEGTQVVLYTDADYTPESGAVTQVDILDSNNNVLKSYENISGTSMTINAGDFTTSDATVAVNLYAVNGDLQSLQKVVFYIVPPVAQTSSTTTGS